MQRLLHLVALALVFGATSLAWLVFAAVMASRTDQLENSLQGDVAELWGQPMVQEAPRGVRHVWREETRQETVVGPDGQPVFDASGLPRTVARTVRVAATERLPLEATDLDVTLQHDPRRKGLIWFSLYDVALDGTWSFTQDPTEGGEVTLTFPFPQADGIYDAFRFEVDGQPVDAAPADGMASHRRYVAAGETVTLRVAYKSRGRDEWAYRPVDGWQTGEVRDFAMDLHTDFADIDYPGRTLSPSTRTRDGDGWTLRWSFDRLITGQGMGMVTPQRVQAGELGARLSLSAPISLGLFMVWVSILGLLRGVEIHPVNHAFVAAAFFSFHLLFGYTADHLPVEAAFALSSAVSVLLTVSYLRLVAGPRFALVQAGGAQLLYQVGFGAAHFVDGWTGLTLTVLLVGTLFLLMQQTGHIRWAEVFAGPARSGGGRVTGATPA